MLAAKDLLSQFKASTWSAPEEVEAFLAAAEAPPPADLLRLLEVLLARPPEPAIHRARAGIFARLLERTPDKSLFVPLARALKNADAGLRTFLATLVQKVNSPTEHAELCAHLRSTDAQLRQVTARVLVQLGGGKTVFELLGKAVAEKEYPGRLEAMEVLVSFAKAQAIPALQSALEAGNLAERVLALKLLGDPKAMAKDPALALKAIIPALSGQPEPVLTQAIISFSTLCSEDDYWEYAGRFLESGALSPVRAAVDGLKRFRSPRTISALERRLLAGPRGIRLAVLNTLEAIGTDEVLPPLVEALGHKQVPVRSRAGASGSPAAPAGFSLRAILSIGAPAMAPLAIIGAAIDIGIFSDIFISKPNRRFCIPPPPIPPLRPCINCPSRSDRLSSFSISSAARWACASSNSSGLSFFGRQRWV